MRLIITGDPEFDDYRLLKEKLNKITQDLDYFTVLTTSDGNTDKMVERWIFRSVEMRKRCNRYSIYHLDRNKHGTLATPIRNEEMIDNADVLIIFWDGVFQRSRKLIQAAKDAGLTIRIIKYKEK